MLKDLRDVHPARYNDYDGDRMNKKIRDMRRAVVISNDVCNNHHTWCFDQPALAQQAVLMALILSSSKQ